MAVLGRQFVHHCRGRDFYKGYWKNETRNVALGLFPFLIDATDARIVGQMEKNLRAEREKRKKERNLRSLCYVCGRTGPSKNSPAESRAGAWRQFWRSEAAAAEVMAVTAMAAVTELQDDPLVVAAVARASVALREEINYFIKSNCLPICH